MVDVVNDQYAAFMDLFQEQFEIADGRLVAMIGIDECEVDFRFEFKKGEPREFVQQNACTMNGNEFVID